MSFADNLENSLKSLESQEERAGERESQEKRDAERVQALAIAPWAEQLKSSAFVPKLLDEATRAGHAIRVKVHITWLGSTLRLEARDRKLELRPTAEGVVAAFIQDGSEARQQPIELAKTKPEELVRSWLK
jgi:hypothetical protein